MTFPFVLVLGETIIHM